MRLILYFAALVVLASCATQPVAIEGTKIRGHWETKALIRDFKKQKNTSLSIDFISIWSDRLRAEVTGPFGVSVASLVINKGQLQLAVHTQKKFYSGKVSERSLVGLIGFPLDPKILINVLFDMPPGGSAWLCHKDAAGIVMDCKNSENEISVHWTERKGELKRVVISREDYEIQFLVKDFNTKVQDANEYFNLNRPESYVSHQLD